MSIIMMIIVGLIVGIIAKMLMPGRDPGGFIVTTLLGIAGSVVAGYIGRAMGIYREGDPAGLIASVLGAILLLAIYRAVVGQRRVA
ncbi:MAG TPA: GlsB/YeaQ/YmgE family stress response membrane protein [Bdellovibrionales bacterium]|nr:GlsB/YeaQ/YmgE family stress response membrane protein [Bdellovibrionales bacterium]